MKYITIVALLFLVSCSPSAVIPFKGTYPVTPIIVKSEKTFDETWDRLVDVFTQKGLSIKMLDKSSGLIVSQKSLLPVTFEDKSGNPVNSQAFIVVPSVVAMGRRQPISGSLAGPYATEKQIAEKAVPVYGDWNVRIKPNGNNSTITVNINNVYYDYYNTVAQINVPTSINSFKTTGVFEAQLADLIK